MQTQNLFIPKSFQEWKIAEIGILTGLIQPNVFQKTELENCGTSVPVEIVAILWLSRIRFNPEKAMVV